MTQSERRDAGLSYIADAAMMEEQRLCRSILGRLNRADPADFEGIQQIVHELLGRPDAWINPPFYCDYGTHIRVGKHFYANYNCTILDVAQVVIGDNCMLAPNVAIYTAGHPIHPESRNSGYEYGAGVSIGDNVWLGGNVVVTPGVTIGSNTVVGAGSVVTKNLPDWVIAAGNPCRVIRPITEADRRFYFKGMAFDQEAWAEITRGS